MEIIHIEHSSAYIETEEFQILLDVTNDELTSIREDKPLVIFNTHGHRDHYHPSIFGYEAKNVSVTYVIFDEIKLPMEKKENLFPMKAHQRLSLFGGKIDRIISPLMYWNHFLYFYIIQDIIHSPVISIF